MACPRRDITLTASPRHHLADAAGARVRHLRWLAERIGDDLLDAVVVTTGGEAYRRADGIAVVPAGSLGP